MKIFLKILAATVVMAGVCLLVYELFRRWDEGGRRRPDFDLERFTGRKLNNRRKKDSDTIADYRYDDDDDLFDDDFFADLDGGSRTVEVEMEGTAAKVIRIADDDDGDDVISDEGFDLSEDALEQLLDN